jgi:hypothetical protein
LSFQNAHLLYLSEVFLSIIVPEHVENPAWLLCYNLLNKGNGEEMMSRFREVFPKGHVVLPVIHVESLEQTLRNVAIAMEAQADGVFLINHYIRADELLDIHAAVADAFPDCWIGVNCLDLDPHEVFARVSHRVDGIWTDNAMIDEHAVEQPEAEAVLQLRRSRGWRGLYFGGVAFKYQRHVDDVASAAVRARAFMDVVTTSGAGTGIAASVEKIRRMKTALGDFPLAIASGITPENVVDYLPHSDCYLVATGISKSFEELDPPLVQRLVHTVRSFDQRDEGS